MRKVWTYKRKGTKGWWVGWYESGIRIAKALPTKALAEHYCRIKYTQLNWISKLIVFGIIRSVYFDSKNKD